MADGYGPITAQRSSTFVTEEENARREDARIARQKEVERRRDLLLQQGKKEAVAKEEVEQKYKGQLSHPRTKRPKTVMVDGVEMPIDDEIAKIPAQMDFEDRVLSSPLKQRALARARTEELTAEGLSPEKAAEQARKEQEGRAAAYQRGQKAIRDEPRNTDKEGRTFAESLVSSTGAPVARVLGYGQMADETEARSAGVQSEMARHREETYGSPRIAGAVAGAVQNVAQMGPGIAGSMLAGPEVGMAVMAGQFGSQEYSRAAYEGAEAGLAGKELDNYAAIQGGIEASIMPIMSKIPGLGGIEGRVLRQSVARGVASHPSILKSLSSGAVKMTKDTAAELVEEVTTEVLHGFTTEKMLDQDVNYKDIVADTVLQTIVMMGMTEGVQQIGGIAGGGDPFGMRKQPAQTGQPQPVQPEAAPELGHGYSIDEMLQMRDAAANEAPAPQVPPAVEAFTQKPSERNYEAAVSAGMPPIENPNRDGRAKYAADLLKDPFGMRKKVNPSQTGSSPRTETVPNIPPTRPETPDAPQATVPDDEYDSFLNLLKKKGDPRETQNEASQKPEAAQGRQEGLLNPDAAPVEEPATGQAASEQSISSAFGSAGTAIVDNYYDAVLQAITSTGKVPPQERKSSVGKAWEQAKAAGTSPEDFITQLRGDNTPAQKQPPVATGGPLPDQSQPPTEAGPVSKPELPEYARIDKGDDGLFYPGWDKPGKLPQTSMMGFNTEQEAAEWLKPRTGPPRPLPHADPVKGSIGYNNQGLPIFENNAGDRFVDSDPEPARGPRDDRFKTQAELDAEKAAPAPATKPPVPQFTALPQKSQDLFNKAFELRETDALKQMVEKNNVAWNKEFESRTGIKLPKNLKDRHQAVLDWAAPLGKPAPPVKYADTPMWGVYPTIFQGKPKFSVKASDRPFGDTLWDTEAEAREYADTERKRAEERAAGLKKLQDKEEADQKKQQEHEASFQGFLTDDPMVKGRRLKTLDTLVNYEKKPITRKALVEKRVADGWTVNAEDQFQAPTGEFLDAGALTKTGIDYARHLVDLKPKAETPAEDSEKAVPWRRTADEERSAYNKRLKKEGWTASPKPSISALDSPGAVKQISLDQQKKSPFKKGDRLTVHTGFSTDEMQIGGEAIEDSLPESPQVKVRVDSGKVHYVMAYYLGRDKPAEKAPEKPQETKPKAEKPEKTLRGQTILPGMTGMAEEIDRNDFVRKHQSVLLEDMRELVDDEDMLDALRDPVGNILKAVWNGDLKEMQDLYDTDLGDRLWTALTAMIAYHAPAKREAGLESLADEAIRKAFEGMEMVKELKARRKAEGEAYEQVKQYEADGLAQLLEHGEEEGVRAADAGEPDEGFTEKDANEVIDASFDLGVDATRVGDLIIRRGKTGVVTRVRPDGNLTVQFEETMASGMTVSPRYSGFAIVKPDDYVKVGTAPFPVTLEQFYAQFGDKDAIQITTEFMSTWDLLSKDDKSRFAHRLRKFGIAGAKSNSKASKIAESVANVITKSKGVPGKLREVYDIANEYPNLQNSANNPGAFKQVEELMRRIDRVGLSLPPMVRAAMVIKDQRRELLHDLAKQQFGEDIADAMFDESEDAQQEAAAPAEPSQEDLMEQILREELLGETPSEPAKAPKPAKTKATSPLSKEDLKQLRDDVANNSIGFMRTLIQDKIIRNRARIEEKGNTAKQIDTFGRNIQRFEAMLAALDKKERPAKPKTPRIDAAKKRTERTAAELKAAEDDVFKAFGSTMNTGLNPEQMRATARLVKAALNHNVSKFNEFVAYVVDKFGEPMALRMAEGIELAWRTLKRLPEYSGIDDAGKVADVLGPEKEVNDETSTTSDAGVGGMPGESGGTLAPEAGVTPEVGDAEADTGSDGDSVSGGTDSAAETESDGTGTVSEGSGSEQSSGAKPKPGRNPAVKGSRKPAVRVPKQVGAPVNLRIGPDDTIAPGGVVSKLKANIAAIKLLKDLQKDNRQATEADQRILMQYTGWGSLQHAFDENRGKEFIERPGLKEQYGEWYKKALLYQKKDQYSSLEELQKRVEAWEKQWGDSYRYLKENLTPDEWKRAKASVLNAHFTSRDVITNGIWGALEQMGVTGGRFMEPSSGIGSLIGLMPEAIANNSEVIAIELDSLTGDMVKQLYPDADVHVKGFEEVPIPAGTIDVAATNVPFHAIGPADAKTRYGRDMNLHNYFIARILDSLRPGGIAAVITTHFTMDANSEDRALLAGKADLVGAIRLPNTAFKANAGTEVTTDILFFRKPDGSPFRGESWQNLASVGTYTYKKKKTKKGPLVDTEGNITVNEYFAAHPEMVLGTHSMDGTQYSDTEYTVMPVQGANIADQLQKAVAHLPAGIATTDNAPLMPSLDTGTAGVDGRIEFRGGKLQELSKGEWKAPSWLKDAMTLTKKGEPIKNMKDATKAKKIADAVTQGIAYTKVRNAYEIHLANMRNAETTQAEYEKSQKALNVAYDAYREKHGALNHKDSKWLVRDPGFFFASGLEAEVELIENGDVSKSYAKADVFRERTVNPDAAPTKADTTEDAVKMSLAWRGAINLPWMSELTGTSEEDLEAELLDSGTVFLNPETSLLEPADTYLAGNVQAKLRQSEKAVAEGDKRFERNVEMLKEVQPPKRTIDSITPSLGQNWVPHEVVNRWLTDVLKLEHATVRYNVKADIWSVSTGSIPRDVQNEWGTLGMHLSDLLPKTLNGSTIRIMKPNPEDSKKSVLDEAQTQAAQIKAEKMRDSFEAWAKSDEKSIPLIEQAFNEQKNFYVKPQYNGEHLTFPGMSEMWLKRMRPYQKNTIWRAIREGRGMIAHGVGAGKTAELIAIAMEMKRLGTATKPLIVVQNSTLGQFARTFTEVYPAAKVLVASKDDLNPENRARFMARIATGNWDAIVMAKSTFNMKLPNDPALEQAMVEGLIAELEAVMLEAQLEDGAGSPSVKAIQQQINSLIKRLEKIITSVNARTDSDVFFEQMGVDALFLDEAHDYKKPPFVTKLDRSIKGLSTDVSGRALSALIKMRFVQGNNRGRNTFMATGTPITNTLGESWLLMNMVAPDVLQEFGVTTFDQFVATFARVISSLEPNAVGKLQRKTRLAKFKNGHQLAQFIQSGWDVLLGEDLHSKIREYGGGKIPKMENGKETLVMVDRSPAFDAFGKFFLDVYGAYKELTGEDKRTYSWIPVVIYGAAKAAAIDVRLVDPTAPDDPGSKLNKMVEGVYSAYKEGTDVTLQVGDETLAGQNLTQLIFSDVSGRTDTSKLRMFAAGEGVTMEIVEDDESESGDDSGDDDAPSTSKVKEDRWLYNEIKRKLIEKGVPEDQVQLINDHNGTAAKLLAFQDRVNAGDVRIVIGHSDTLGTGVNVQTRLKAIWELDIPMVPAKREQRIGRMIRSGNLNEIVQSFVMAMQRSLDGNLMSMNLRKAKAAEQALSGKLGAEFEDPFSESLMSMADMEAAMNDDPLFYRQRELEFQVRSRRLEMEALDQQRSRERSRLRGNEFTIERLKDEIAKNAAVANKVAAALKADHPFVVDGKKIVTLKEAEKALKATFDSESDRISKETQDSKAAALNDYYAGGSQHVAGDAEFGPIQFNLMYGERPAVVLDDKGEPSTTWKSTSGTLITMDGKKIEETRATTLGSIMEFLKGSVPATRNWMAVKQKEVDEKTAENVKLAEFLAKPSEAQIELDNLESQLAQVNQLMFERDNPGAAPANPPTVPVTQEQMPKGYELVAPGSIPTLPAIVAMPQKTNDVWHIYAPGGFTVTPGGADTAQLAYHKAQQDPEHGNNFPTLKETPPEADAPVESDLRKKAREAKEAIFIQKAKNARFSSSIRDEWEKITRGEVAGSGLGLTDEMYRAIAGRVLGEIRLGVKRFDALVKTLRAEFDESIVQELKPNFIAIWNSVREKYSLDDATDAGFDAAMSKTVDVDLEQAVEAAKSATAPEAPTSVPGGDNKTFSTKNAFTDAARDELDMPERPPVERQGREPSVDAAKELGQTTSGSDRIDRLILELQASPRSVTPFENDLLNYRQAELNNKLDNALRAKIKAAKGGDDVQQAISDQEAAKFRQESQGLIEILELIGTEAGRNLQARKAVINREFTLERQALEFEAAHGRAPNAKELEAMQKQVDDLNAKIAELDKLLADSNAKNNDLQAKLKEAHDNLVNTATAPPDAPEPTTAKTPPAEKEASPRQKAAREKIKNAYKRLTSMLQDGTAFSVGGALGESASVFIDLATGYSELGVITLGQFLKRVTSHMGPAAKQLIPQLTAAWKQVRGAAGQADISSVTDTIDPMDPDTIGRAARNLHAYVIERDGLDASPEGREAAVAAVHSILVDFVPGLTIDDTARAMSGIGIYSELSDNEIEVIRRDQKAQLLLMEQIEDWKKGTPPPATGQERPPVSDEQRALRKLVNEAKKASGLSTATAGQLRSALDAAKRMANNRIKDLTKAIESGTRIAKSQKLLQPDAELTALQNTRDALQKLYDETFGKPELSDEQRLNMAEKALDRAIADMEADLKTGKLYPDAPKARVSSPAIEAKRAALAALKASRDELRLQSGEAQQRSDAAYERHLLERDAELARRIAAKDFMPAAKKPQRVLTPAMTKLMLSIDQQKQAIQKQRKAWEFANRHIIVRMTLKGPVAGAHMIRKALTMWDQSLIGRQGFLLGITHPITYGKAIRKAFASNPWTAKSLFPTEQDLFDTQAALDSDANWVRLEKIGKVAVTDVHGGINREEGSQFVPEWFDKIWGVGASERAGSAFINTQRRLVFRSLVEKLATKLDGKRTVSNAELRVIGNLVNVASGRGSLGKWANSLEALTLVFFSPRWWASRLQWWTGQPVWHDSRWTGGEGASWEVRQMAAVEWAKQAAAQAAIMGLVIASLTAAFGDPGDDEEWDWYGDPRSPDFGRIRIGSTPIDMTAGLGQHLALFARLFSGKQVDRWETKDVDALGLIGRHERGKLAPVPSAIVDYFAGESISKEKFGSKEWLLSHVTPLIAQDIRESTAVEGIPLGPVLAAMMFFGIGAQSREARTKERSDVANELRALKKQGKSPEKIQTVLNDHLEHAAAIEAKEDLRTADPEEQAALQKVIDGEKSPELTAAIEKEKWDIVLNASARISSDARRISNDEKLEFTGSDDKGRLTARSLVPMMIPDVNDAIKLYDAAYKARNRTLYEKKDGNLVPKPSVLAGRYRIRQLYRPGL